MEVRKRNETSQEEGKGRMKKVRRRGTVTVGERKMGEKERE
jgi:hypothetical protein